jgi:uncharacterized protein (TIGR02246 family)
MNTQRTSLLLVFFALALAGCQPGVQPDSTYAQDAQQDIRGAHAQFLKAFNGKDAAGVAAVYTEDGMLMPPNAGLVAGRAGIQTFAGQMFGTNITGLLLETPETMVLGDYAYTRGFYSMLGTDGSVVDRGKFLEIWRHDGGHWLMYRDIFNSDVPVGAASAPTPAPAAATH